MLCHNIWMDILTVRYSHPPFSALTRYCILEGKLCGLESDFGMLDTSRLSLADTEHCAPFKIFTLVAHGLPPREVADVLRLTSTVKESLVGSSNHGGYGIDGPAGCAKELQYLKELLAGVGVTADLLTSMQELLAAILHLQSLSVQGGDGSAVFSSSSKAYVGHAEKVLKMEGGTLGPLLLKRTIEVSGSKNVTDLTAVDCKCAINALSSELYQRIIKCFLRTADAFARRDAVVSSEPNLNIRIIDASGNEWLEHSPNRLAQFCVNIVEEKFNEHHIFVSFQKELAFLRSEGVDAPPCEVRDTELVMAVVEHVPGGVLGLLEEVSLLPRGNDDSFLEKVFSSHSKSKLVKNADRNAKKSCFIVKHSFGDVQYDSEGFILSNRERLSPEILNLINGQLSSSFPLISTGEAVDTGSASNVAPSQMGKGGRAAEKAIPKGSLFGTKTRDYVSSLLQSITGTEDEGIADPIIVLCVRPNVDPRSFTFDPSFTVGQIKYLSVPELCDFTKKCYPMRQRYTEFYDTYRVMFAYNFPDLPWKIPASHDKKVLCRSLIRECCALACIPNVMDVDNLAPMLGSTVIFFRKEVIDTFTKLRSDILKQYRQAAVSIQSSVRKKLNVLKYKKSYAAVLLAQSFVRMFVRRIEFKRTLESARKIQGFYMTKKLSRDFCRMKSACATIKRSLLNKMIQRIRYKKLIRATRTLQMLSKGFIIRQHINHILRSVLQLQSFARDFLRRNKLHYFKLASVFKIQRVFRGANVRSMNRPIVRVLKIRRNQRKGTSAVVRLQSIWRSKLIRMRKTEIASAASCLQRWFHARMCRVSFLKVLSLTKWLQCSSRRLKAVNEANFRRVKNMLQQEAVVLENLRKKELSAISYSSISSANWGGLQLGGGFYRNNHDKFGRFLIGLDILFDTEAAYPNGWLNMVLDFDRLAQSSGKRRLNQIAVGRMHTVLVDSAHNVYTVGMGDSGQLGHGGKSNESSPRRMESLIYQSGSKEGAGISRGIAQHVDIKCVVAGRDHTLLLTSSGHVYSWGGNRRGQLGHSDFNNCALPRVVLGFKNAKVIVCGSYHSACLADPGIVFTWGARECLGRAEVEDCCTAQSLPFFSKRRVQALVSGDIHLTVRSGMDFYSWGLNSHGQLGSGGSVGEGEENPCAPLPVQVKIQSNQWTEADALSSLLVAGGRHMLLAVRHKLWSWGWNKFGQVGCNTFEAVITSPQRITLPGSDAIVNGVSCGAATASILVQMTAGWRHSMAMTKGGQIFVWGHPGLHSANARSIEGKLAKQNSFHGEVTENLKVELESGPNSIRFPHVVDLLPKMSERKVFGIMSVSSNTISLCSVELEEPLEIPIASVLKQKHISTRKVSTIKYHEGTDVQNEVNKRLRSELGAFGRTVFAKKAAAKLEENSSKRNEGNAAAKPQTLKRQISGTSTFLNESNERKSSVPLYDRNREGELSDDGILSLFSPLKKNAPPVRIPHLRKNVMDYFTTKEDVSNSNVGDKVEGSYSEERGDGASKISLNQQKIGSGSSSQVIGRRASAVPDRNGSPLSKFTRRRRTSMAATADITEISPIQAKGKASVAAATNNNANAAGGSNSNVQPKGEGQRSNTATKVKRYASLNNEIDSIQRDMQQQRNASKISSSGRAEAACGSKNFTSLFQNEGNEGDNKNDSNLSLVTVSDLAMMIQSIKKESMKEMSLSWRH